MVDSTAKINENFGENHLVNFENFGKSCKKNFEETEKH